MFARLFLVAAVSASALFSSYDTVSLTLTAPFAGLFEHARGDDDYGVQGTLTYDDGVEEVTVEDLRIKVRGNSSKRESECSFPKLRVEFPKGARAAGGLFEGLSSIKIGTHCGDADRGLTADYGRLPNEQSPLREGFVYRLLEAVGVPTLKARPARITYIDTGERPGATPRHDRPLVRNAFLLEGNDEAVERLGGTGTIDEKSFTNARDQFAPEDTARLAFAEAMIGNFDWCLRMTPDDKYRCDDEHPVWNIVAATAGRRAWPIMYDFDLSGMVTGPHPWFHNVFNEQFVRDGSQVDTEVVAQVQRTRSLFDRGVLDATRAWFVQRKAQAYAALGAATLDDASRENARAYLDSFYDAIERTEAFYRPIVAVRGALVYSDAERHVVCPVGSDIPMGTPVSDPLQISGRLMQVMVLDALWRWGPPVKCPAVHDGPVWIDRTAVRQDYPR
jgi:hypothetical protein